MDFSNTRLSLRRSITSYAKVQHILSGLLRNRPLQINRRKLERKQYLDLGCGPNTHPEFINLDYNWRPDIDVCWDITRGLPLNSESLQGIFSEHCFEHLPFAAVDNILGECWRVLRPGGVARIVVPDGELYLTGYVQLVGGQTSRQLPYATGDAYQGLYSPIMSVNRIFRAHGHVFIYDFYTLRQLLEKNHFSQIAKMTFHSSRDPMLLIDTPSRAEESLYVEAAKPLR